MLTVRDLIEALEKFPSGAIVYVSTLPNREETKTVSSIAATYDFPEKISNITLLVRS